MLGHSTSEARLSPLASKVRERCVAIVNSTDPSLSKEEQASKAALINLNAVDSFYKDFSNNCRAQHPDLEEAVLEEMFLKFTDAMFTMKLKVADSALVNDKAKKAYEAQMQEAAELEKPFTTLEHEAEGLKLSDPTIAAQRLWEAQAAREVHEKSSDAAKVEEIRSSAFLELARSTPDNLSHVTVEKGESFARIAWTAAQSRAVDSLGEQLSEIFEPIGGVEPLSGTDGGNLYSSPIGKEGAMATGNFLEGTGAGSVMDQMFGPMKALFVPNAYTDTPEGHKDTALFMLMWNGLSQQYIHNCVKNQATPDVTIYLPSEEVSPTSVFWNTEFQRFRQLQDEVQQKGGHLYFNVLNEESKPALDEIDKKIRDLEEKRKKLPQTIANLKDTQEKLARDLKALAATKTSLEEQIAKETQPERKAELMSQLDDVASKITKINDKITTIPEHVKNFNKQLNTIDKLLDINKKKKTELLKTCWKKVSLPNLKMKGSEKRLGTSMLAANLFKRKMLEKRIKETRFLINYKKIIGEKKRKIQEKLKEGVTPKTKASLFQQLANLEARKKQYEINQAMHKELNAELGINPTVNRDDNNKIVSVEISREELIRKHDHLIDVRRETLRSKIAIQLQMSEEEAPTATPTNPETSVSTAAEAFQSIRSTDDSNVTKSSDNIRKRALKTEKERYQSKKRQRGEKNSVIDTPSPSTGSRSFLPGFAADKRDNRTTTSDQTSEITNKDSLRKSSMKKS